MSTKEREYIVKKASNGFIVRFGHIENSYREENLKIAVSLEDVVEIIKTDLNDPLEGGLPEV